MFALCVSRVSNAYFSHAFSFFFVAKSWRISNHSRRSPTELIVQMDAITGGCATAKPDLDDTVLISRISTKICIFISNQHSKRSISNKRLKLI